MMLSSNVLFCRQLFDSLQALDRGGARLCPPVAGDRDGASADFDDCVTGDGDELGAGLPQIPRCLLHRIAENSRDTLYSIGVCVVAPKDIL